MYLLQAGFAKYQCTRAILASVNCIGFTIKPLKEGWGSCFEQCTCKCMSNVLISPGDITWQSHRLPGAADLGSSRRCCSTQDGTWGILIRWVVAGSPGQPHGAMLPRLSFLGKLCVCHHQTGRGAPVTCKWPGCPCPSTATCELARLSSARAAGSAVPHGQNGPRAMLCVCLFSKQPCGLASKENTSVSHTWFSCNYPTHYEPCLQNLLPDVFNCNDFKAHPHQLRLG